VTLTGCCGQAREKEKHDEYIQKARNSGNLFADDLAVHVIRIPQSISSRTDGSYVGWNFQFGYMYINFEQVRKERKMKEKIWQWIAWHLPRSLVYWASVRLIANATMGKYASQDVTTLKAYIAQERWEE
jgi:hypothetical protein